MPNHSAAQPNHAVTAEQLLSIWQQHPELEWAAGFLVDRRGSSYRKPGAMMLFNSLGQHFGLLSGGCVEQQLMQQANRCITNRQATLLELDLQADEDAENWQAAIGCGGAISVVIAPLSEQNDHLQLASAYQLLTANQCTRITIEGLDEGSADNLKASCAPAAMPKCRLGNSAELADDRATFTLTLQPSPRLFIAGAGIDAIPLAQIASQLGWQVSVNETRSQQQRSMLPATIERLAIQAPADCQPMLEADSIIIMHHNLALDTQWLAASLRSKASYIGVLGPKHRLDHLLVQAGTSREDFEGRLHGPCGLPLGGDTPASVALSIISDVHRTLATVLTD